MVVLRHLHHLLSYHCRLKNLNYIHLLRLEQENFAQCTAHIDRTQKVAKRCTAAQSTKSSSPEREIAKRTVDSLHEFPLVKLGVEENAKESGLDLSVRVWRRNDTNLAKAI